MTEIVGGRGNLVRPEAISDHEWAWWIKWWETDWSWNSQASAAVQLLILRSRDPNDRHTHLNYDTLVEEGHIKVAPDGLCYHWLFVPKYWANGQPTGKFDVEGNLIGFPPSRFSVPEVGRLSDISGVVCRLDLANTYGHRGRITSYKCCFLTGIDEPNDVPSRNYDKCFLYNFALNSNGAGNYKRMLFGCFFDGTKTTLLGGTFHSEISLIACEFYGDLVAVDSIFKSNLNCFDPLRPLEKTIFHGKANFSSCTFEGAARFSNVVFKSEVTFANSIFQSLTDFTQTDFVDTLKATRCFEKSVFKSRGWFTNTSGVTGLEVFAGATFLNGVTFAIPKSELSMAARYIKIKDDTKRRLKASNDLAGAQALRVGATFSGDKPLEHALFVHELHAREFLGEQNRVERLFSKFYGGLSGYGYSLSKPLFWFIVTLLTFALFYAVLDEASDASPFSGGFDWSEIGDGIEYSLSRMLPIGPWTPLVSLDSALQLKLGVGQTVKDVNWMVRFGISAISTVQSLISALLAFLFVLAVRRKFQVS
jgi:Pentapeptide repeats (9 copies)